MAIESYANAAATTLAAAITLTGATAITVASAAPFPSSGQYKILIDAELMTVTGGQGTTTWTVTRADEGTTAATHLVGAAVTHLVSAASLRRIAEGIAVVASADASYNFSAATGLWLPQAAGAAPANTGQIAHDTTQRRTQVRDAVGGIGSISRVLSAVKPTSDALSAATGTGVQNFATTYTVPANYLIANKFLRLTCMYSLLTTTTIPTSKPGLSLGGTAVWGTAALTPAQGTGVTSYFGFQFLVAGTAAPGASVSVETNWLQAYLGGSLWSWGAVAQPVALATSGALVLQPTWQFGGTGASNTATLRMFLVEELN